MHVIQSNDSETGLLRQIFGLHPAEGEVGRQDARYAGIVTPVQIDVMREGFGS